MRLAFFVSPHGFGHAARATALMLALRERQPRTEFSLYTRVPRWFFSESLPFDFDAVDCLSDIGLRQAVALEIDLPATERALDRFFPFSQTRIEALADELRASSCAAVVCDISPLGIAVAQAVGIPAVLVENFTWDWIYQPYLRRAPSLARVSEGMAALFQGADLHLQAEPVCRYRADADAVVAPICRPVRAEAAAVKQALGLDPALRLVVITQGGMPQPLSFLDALRSRRDIQFLVTGMQRSCSEGNLHCLDNHTIVYMPDVVAAADAVVGKLGYSIVAETWQAGTPMGYVPRDDFRESPALAAFVDHEMPGLPIPREAFESGAWLSRLDELLALPKRELRAGGGAGEAAERLLAFLAEPVKSL